MRVLFITHYVAMMGANRSMLQLILELREKGVEPFVLLPSSTRIDSDLRDNLDRERIGWRQIPFRKVKDGSRKHCISNYIKSLWCSCKAIRVLKDEEFDLVHSNGSLFDMGSWIARYKRIPHIWHLREFGDIDYGMRTPFGKWYQRILYAGKNNHFIAISQAVYNHYKRYIGSNRLNMIYNGLPSNNYCNRNLQIPTSTIEICLVGLLHEAKRPTDAIEAIYKVVEKGYRNIHLHLVGGGDADYIVTLRRKIQQFGLGEFVILEGHIADVPKFLVGKQIGLMTSSSEAFGRVTIEYMMSGMAVIASDTGANPEIVTEGTGLLYPCGDIDKLAASIIKLIDEPALMAYIANKGQNRAMEEFTSHANAEKVKSLYDRVLN